MFFREIIKLFTDGNTRSSNTKTKPQRKSSHGYFTNRTLLVFMEFKVNSLLWLRLLKTFFPFSFIIQTTFAAFGSKIKFALTEDQLS